MFITWRTIIIEASNSVINLERRDVEKALLEYICKHGTELLPRLRAGLSTGNLLVLLHTAAGG